MIRYNLFKWSSNVACFNFLPFYFVGLEYQVAICWENVASTSSSTAKLTIRWIKSFRREWEQPHKSHLFNSLAGLQDTINSAAPSKWPLVFKVGSCRRESCGGSIFSINSNFLCDYCRVNTSSFQDDYYEQNMAKLEWFNRWHQSTSAKQAVRFRPTVHYHYYYIYWGRFLKD